MTPSQSRAIERERRIRDAMAALVGNTNFVHFIEILRFERDTAMEHACMDSVVASQRLSMAAIGEVRMFNTVISLYDEWAAVPEAEGES